MDPKQLDAIERWNLVFAAVFVASGALLFDARVALGVAVGALLCCANFYGIHKLILLSMRAQGGKRAVLQILLAIKMLALMLLIYAALKYLPLSPVALAIGLSIFFLSIAVVSLRFALSGKESDGRA